MKFKHVYFMKLTKQTVYFVELFDLHNEHILKNIYYLSILAKFLI
jgi:hypothetical protein